MTASALVQLSDLGVRAGRELHSGQPHNLIEKVRPRLVGSDAAAKLRVLQASMQTAFMTLDYLQRSVSGQRQET